MRRPWIMPHIWIRMIEPLWNLICLSNSYWIIEHHLDWLALLIFLLNLIKDIWWFFFLEIFNINLFLSLFWDKVSDKRFRLNKKGDTWEIITSVWYWNFASFQDKALLTLSNYFSLDFILEANSLYQQTIYFLS